MKSNCEFSARAEMLQTAGSFNWNISVVVTSDRYHGHMWWRFGAIGSWECPTAKLAWKWSFSFIHALRRSPQ